MNKTVLVLINGLGVEDKYSCNIYSRKVMPTLDKSTTSELFTTIESKAYDYSSGYQIFNTGSTELLSIGFFDNIDTNELWNQNEQFKDMSLVISGEKTNKLHIFFSLNSPKSFDHLKSLIKFLNTKKSIIIHVILNGKSLEDYKMIEKTLARFNYEALGTGKIGTIFGLNLLDDNKLSREFNDLWTMFVKGVGEQWTQPEKKFAFFKNGNVVPENATAFYVNDHFQIENSDTILFFNYDKENYDKIINLLQNPITIFNTTIKFSDIKYYSLLPLPNKDNVISLYPTLTSDTSLSKYMSNINAKALFLIDSQNLNTVRFMNNGLSNQDGPNIDYMLTDNNILFDNNQLLNIISAEKYQLVILNYRIDLYNDEKSLKTAMKRIDDCLTFLKQSCKDKYALIISSLYGMQKTIKMENNTEAMVIFKNTVPVVIINPKLNLKSIKIKTYESLNKLLPTVIKTMKPDEKIVSLIKTKSIIEKLFFK